MQLYVCLHRMDRANLNISKKSLDFHYPSIKVHIQEAQNLYQLKSPLSNPNLLSKITSKCEHCKTGFTSQKTVFGNFMKWGMKGGISIDINSRPLGYVLWFCGSRSQAFFTFIQIGSGHTVAWNRHLEYQDRRSWFLVLHDRAEILTIITLLFWSKR